MCQLLSVSWARQVLLVSAYLQVAVGRIRTRQFPIGASQPGRPTSEIVGLRAKSSEGIEDHGSEIATTKELPVFVPSGNLKQPLVERRFSRNFTNDEMSALNYTESHGFKTPQCTASNTVFDLGFYDGADSKAYLEGGFCVVAIEADPYLVQLALTNFGVWLSTGQLRLANVALSPPGNMEKWTTFYLSKCTREWNSFYSTVGCRSCVPPHEIDMNACVQIPVKALSCKAVFGTFGQPHYLKLDIEGAEPGCFEAMQDPQVKPYLPQYLSSEITEVEYLDQLYQLGFRSFKLVRQDALHSGIGSHSGPWGNNALDCRGGTSWRTYEVARAEFAQIIYKPFNASDPCPGGICPIHGNGCNRSAQTYMWYDVHVTWGLPT